MLIIKKKFIFEQKYKEGKFFVLLFWWLYDGMSWLNSNFVRSRIDYLLLFDRELQPKPVFMKLLRLSASGF